MHMNMSKRLLVLIFSIISFVLSTVPSYAFSLPLGGVRQELRKEIKEDKKEIRNDAKELKNDTKDLIKLNRGAKILSGTVTAKDGSNLTVEKDGKKYTVQTDGNTQFRRHFWGNSSLSEIAIGDKVNIYGKFTDDQETTILARLIRDVSIMKRFGAFIGSVGDLSGTAFTLNTVARGAQKVTLNDSTKCVNRKEETITCSSDLQNGHRVRVKGMWNKTNSTITEVTHLKDYSLPPSVSE